MTWSIHVRTSVHAECFFQSLMWPLFLFLMMVDNWPHNQTLDWVMNSFIMTRLSTVTSLITTQYYIYYLDNGIIADIRSNNILIQLKGLWLILDITAYLTVIYRRSCILLFCFGLYEKKTTHKSILNNYNQPTTTTFNIGIYMYKTWLNDNCRGESSIFRRSRILPWETTGGLDIQHLFFPTLDWPILFFCTILYYSSQFIF